MRLQATQEGLVPLKNWVKCALDRVIQVSMGEPGLEFAWVGDDAIDPLQQAQTLNILVSSGIKTREEARAELGLGGDGKAASGLGKYNQYHDEAGRFATADNAVETGGRSRPKGVRVASRDTATSDADDVGSSNAQANEVAQIIEPEPIEPPPLKPREAPRPVEGAPAAPAGTVADAVAPKGELPGVADKLGAPRTMPASDDPDSTARAYVLKAYNGQSQFP